MNIFQQLLENNEEWLMGRILSYAKDREYTRFTSTLKEAWRLSIAGISSSMISMLDQDPDLWEMGPDDDFAHDPAAAFGISEAKRHRERGIALPMFMGLLKYYRQSYFDLVFASDLDDSEKSQHLRFIERYFDRVEIALAQEWASLAADKRIGELQSANRRLTNEKNKFLTIFESIPNPVIILDKEDRVVNLNTGALLIQGKDLVPGGGYYLNSAADSSDAMENGPAEQFGRSAAWLRELLDRFTASEQQQYSEEITIPTINGERCFQAHATYMGDISDKFRGKVVVLEDVTDSKRGQEERVAREKLQAVIETAGGACHELNQPLQAVLAALELAIWENGDVDPVRGRLETIKTEVGRLIKISEGLREITEHRTKQYIDDMRILDLDKSTGKK